MRWTPEELAAAAGGRLLARGDREIATAFIDSRLPRSGALFVPLVAARDGHEFIQSALTGGASATLKEVSYQGAMPEGMTVVEVDNSLEALTRLARQARAARKDKAAVAITGSNGKTTTRAMVEAVMRSAFDAVLSTKGNFNNHLGLPLSLLDEPHEPEAEVLELGMSAPGENDHLASIVQPQIGIITSIALEHLEFMGTLEAIAKAEAEVVPHIVEGGALVLPSDAPLLDAEIPESFDRKVYRVGPDAHADLRILEVEVGERTKARIRLPSGEEVNLALRTFGAHNARNAAAALAVALHLGLPLGPACAALEEVEPVGDRGRLRDWKGHLLICDCYNANPGSMKVALESLAALRSQRSGPLVAVLGDMLELGPTEEELHAEVGELAAQLGIDALVAFGPRSEAAAKAAQAKGIAAVHVGESVEQALEELATRFAGQGPGAILFKGSRGMALERVIEGLG